MFTNTQPVESSENLSPPAVAHIVDSQFNRYLVNVMVANDDDGDHNANVSWTFVAKTGDLKNNLKAALTVGDFLVLTGDLQGFGSHLLIDQLRSSPTGTRGVVVTARDSVSPKSGPVVAIIDGYESGRESVILAKQLASVAKTRFELFVIAANDKLEANIVQLIRETLDMNTPFTTRRFLPGASQPIVAALMSSTPCFVVAELDREPFDSDKSTLEILRAAHAPIVLLQSKFSSPSG